MELIFRITLFIAGVINLLPSVLAFLPDKISKSYGIEIPHAGASIYLCHSSSGLYLFYFNHYPMLAQVSTCAILLLVCIYFTSIIIPSHAGASIYLCHSSSGLYLFYFNHYPFPYSKNKKYLFLKLKKQKKSKQMLELALVPAMPI
jgi:hypothetical protein